MDHSPAHIPAGAFAGDSTVFLYSGRFHDGQTPHLITLGEEVLERDDPRAGGRNKLAFIMVEAFQNILRHRDRDAGGARSLFVMRSRPGRRSVAAVNPMVAGEEDALEELLQRIRAADAPGLKRMFLERLGDSARNPRGGAGLGLIEMARRSGHKLRHRIVQRGDGSALFFLEVVLGDVEGEGETKALDELQHMYEVVQQERIVLHFRHPGAPSILEAVLKVLADDLDEQGRGDARRQAFLAGTDLVRQLCDQGGGRPRGMQLQRVNGDLQMELDCELSGEASGKLAAEVAELNALDTLAVRQRYRRAMLDEARGTDAHGFALLDLARHAQGPLSLMSVEGAEDRAMVRLSAVI